VLAGGFGPEGVLEALDEGSVEESGEGFLDCGSGSALFAREETELDEGIEGVLVEEDGDVVEDSGFASFREFGACG
jgi:hypothetical protein